MSDEDEEALLRSVAEQNAKSIFLARQRADADLRRAHDELAQRTDELARLLAMARATLESTSDGILVTDQDGHVVDCNEQFVKMWGLPADLVESKNHCRLVEIISTYFPDAATFIARLDEIHAAGGAESHDVLELADGRVFERFSRVQVVAGASAGRVWSFRDVTERRAAEESLKEGAAALVESARRKDEFLAMLAHELRNPLAPIKSAVEVIRVGATPGSELEWATDVLDRQVRHMTHLVDDLLDVSRITRGKIALRRETVDLASVVRHAVETSRPHIEKWGHRVDVVLPAAAVLLDADPTRLAQVLGNLLNNAAKYMDQGGTIHVVAAIDGDEVEIRVQDTGIGISRDLLAHVFDLFTQADRSLERAEGGLGIGLTLVQQLVGLE